MKKKEVDDVLAIDPRRWDLPLHPLEVWGVPVQVSHGPLGPSFVRETLVLRLLDPRQTATLDVLSGLARSRLRVPLLIPLFSERHLPDEPAEIILPLGLQPNSYVARNMRRGTHGYEDVPGLILHNVVFGLAQEFELKQGNRADLQAHLDRVQDSVSLGEKGWLEMSILRITFNERWLTEFRIKGRYFPPEMLSYIAEYRDSGVFCWNGRRERRPV